MDHSSDPVVSELTLETAPVQALAALFDDGLVVGRGDLLPPLWHWVALPTWPLAGETSQDGHPRTGGFLPDVGKPRRMFAGGTVDFHGPLVVGEVVRREERVLAVTPKRGSQGDFVLVEVEANLYDGAGALAVHEVQNILYRDAAVIEPAEPVVPSPQEVVPALLSLGERWEFRTDPTKLMRFSAATSNGHRIHYDQPYATQVEGYPGLVVHGPLMTLTLAEVARLTSDRAIGTVIHRNVRPLFCGQPAHVEQTDGELSLVGESGAHCTLAVTLT